MSQKYPLEYYKNANKKVKIDMSLEEYVKKAYEEIRHYIKDEEYISKLDKYIKDSYEEEIIASQILGTKQVGPSGIGYVMSLFCPDLPY